MIISIILSAAAVLLVALGVFFRMNDEGRRSLISLILAAAFAISAVFTFLSIEEDDGARTFTLTIDHYEEDGTFSGDPCFRIWIGYIGESTTMMDETFTSEVFENSMELDAPFEATVELPETVISISFTITVYNGSPAENQIIDCDSGTAYFISRTLTSTFEGTWTSDGSDDGFEDIDCALAYSAAIGTGGI